MEFNLITQYDDSYMSALKELDVILEKLGDREAKKDLLVPKFIAIKTELEPKQVIESLKELYFSDPRSLVCTKRWIPVEVVCDASKIIENIKEYNDDLLSKDKYCIVLEQYRSELDIDELKKNIVSTLRATFDESLAEKFLYVLIFGKIAAISLLGKNAVFTR